MEIKYHECVCEICHSTIKDENIVIFPCRHIFDENCVINTLKKYNLNMMNLSEKLEKILVIKGEITVLEKKKELIESEFYEKNKETKGSILDFLSGKTSSLPNKELKSLSKEDTRQLEKFKNQYYDLLTEDCITCGDLLIQNIRYKFDVDCEDKNSWMIF